MTHESHSLESSAHSQRDRCLDSWSKDLPDWLFDWTVLDACSKACLCLRFLALEKERNYQNAACEKYRKKSGWNKKS
jgi:hypothetical protein